MTIELLACLRDLTQARAAGSPLKGPALTDMRLRQLQALLLLLYHPCEHLAWVDMVAPGAWRPETRKRLDKGALYFSTAATVLMVARSYRRHAQLQAQVAGLQVQLRDREREAVALAAEAARAGRLAADAAAAGAAGAGAGAGAASASNLSFATTVTAGGGEKRSPDELAAAAAAASAASTACAAAVADLAAQIAAARDADGVVLVRATKELADVLGGLHFSLPTGLGLGDVSLNLLGLWSAVVGGYLKWNAMPGVDKY
jgi:hypothetical protein